MLFEWEKDLVSKNKHAVYTKCFDCLLEGINLPLNDVCGNCSSNNTINYYDAETIAIYLKTRDKQCLTDTKLKLL